MAVPTLFIAAIKVALQRVLVIFAKGNNFKRFGPVSLLRLIAPRHEKNRWKTASFRPDFLIVILGKNEVFSFA